MTRTRKPAQPKTEMRLVVARPRDGEDPSIFLIDTLDSWNADRLKDGSLRLFDPAKDDRGPQVKFIATYGNKESTWHPKTSGTYIVAWRPDTPQEVRRTCMLGMGDCTPPQSRRAGIAGVWAGIKARNPKLIPFLRVLKVPCVLRADHPDAPGGSCVEIDPATLPAPLQADQLDATFM